MMIPPLPTHTAIQRLDQDVALPPGCRLCSLMNRSHQPTRPSSTLQLLKLGTGTAQYGYSLYRYGTGYVVLRFVCVIRVPVCARVPCVSRLPPVSFYRYVERRGGLRFFFWSDSQALWTPVWWFHIFFRPLFYFVFLSRGTRTRRTLVACGRQPAVGARRHAYLNETQITFLGCNQRQ